MPVQTSCTGCKAKMRIPDEYANRTVKCPKCGQAFKAAPESASSPVAAAPAAPAKAAPSTALPAQGQAGKTSPAKSPLAASKPGPSTPIPPGKSVEQLAASPTVKRTAPAAKAPPKKKVVEEINVDEAIEEEEVNVDEAVEEEEVSVDEAVEEEEGEEGSPFRSPLLKDDPFEDHEDLPDWFADMIKRELSKGEKIVWVGRTSMRLQKAQAWIALPVGILLVVGAIVALIFSGTVSDWGLSVGLLCCGIFVLLIGGGFTAAPWLVSLSGKYGPVYVLTTRRALIWEAVSRIRTEETFKAYLVPQLVKMERRESALVKGAGDLVFGYRLVVTSQGSRGGSMPQKQPVGFLKLDDVRAVEKMIRETLLDQRTDALFS